MLWPWLLILAIYLLWAPSWWSRFLGNTGRSKDKPESVVVAVMGPTGAGKSSFIRCVTGRSDIIVGHELSSETTESKAYNFEHEGVSFTLVDTPGFDDTRISDSKILENVLAWLETSYKQGTLLNGVVYLHRISDPRMTGSANSNLRMFRYLCGADNFKNVVLATTFWETIDSRLGEKREAELRNNENYWGRMVAKGSRIVRLHQDRASNVELLMQIARTNKKIVVEAQREMKAGKSRSETSAARQVSTEVSQWQQKKELELKAERARLEQSLQEAEQRRRRQLSQATQAQREREQAAQRAEERRADEIRARERKAEQQRALERRKRQEELEEQRRKMEELKKQREQEEREKRQRQRELEVTLRRYQTYECTQASAAATSRCDRCNMWLGTRYYHCCFCYSDRYNQCLGCGTSCRVPEHPQMTQRAILSDVIEGFARRRGIFGELRSVYEQARDGIREEIRDR